jgi:RND family efflux transporter MFP subunit
MKWIIEKRWWISIILMVAVIAGYFVSKRQENPVVTINPTMQSIKETFELSGSVDAYEKIQIPFGTGRISWVGVKEDQTVKKYQSLVKMDTRILEKQKEQGLNSFEKQFRTRDNVIDTYDYYSNSTLTDEEKRAVENSTFDLRNSALTVEITDISAKNALIYTPIEGVVTRLDKKFAGVNAGPADVIEVINPKTIYFSAIVDEAEIAKIKENQTVTIVIDAFLEKTFSSKIDSIDFAPSVSRSGGVGYKIHMQLIDGDMISKLRIGMNGTASILLNENNSALTVPTDVVVYRDGKTFVDLLVNKKIEQREVNVGIVNDTTTEILSGVTATDLIMMPTKGK